MRVPQEPVANQQPSENPTPSSCLDLPMDATFPTVTHTHTACPSFPCLLLLLYDIIVLKLALRIAQPFP